MTAASGADRPNRRLRVAAIAGLVLLVVACAACLIVVFILPRPAGITPRMQQTAEAALQNPASATIDLGTYDFPSWFPADGSDYAVEGNRVIFPQPPEGPPIQRTFQNIMPDKTMPALVYAPGQSLPTHRRPAIPYGRTWAYIGEWFLYDCRPVADEPDWWLCMLLVGGSI
jgi:hypothetical protein